MNLKFESQGLPLWAIRTAVILTILAVFVWQFPARWLLSPVASQTQCKLTIESPAGSIWEGSAAIGFSEPSVDGTTCRPALAVTDRIHWSVTCSLFKPGCKLALESPALNKPLTINLSPTSGVRIQDNEAHLPAEILEVLGAPWTLLHPRAQMQVRWSDLEFQNNQGHGNIRINLSNLSSPISQIEPLGSYEVQAAINVDQVDYTLTTSKGPLLLQLQGVLRRNGASGQGDANATPEMKPALTGLLNLIGKRQGETYRLVF